MQIYALGEYEPETGVSAHWVQGAVKTYVESGRAHRAGLRRLDR